MSSGWLPKHRQLLFQIFEEGPKIVGSVALALNFLNPPPDVLIEDLAMPGRDSLRRSSATRTRE